MCSSIVVLRAHQRGTCLLKLASCFLRKILSFLNYRFYYIEVSLGFPFFCSGSCWGYHGLFNDHVSTGSSWLWWLLRVALFLVTLLVFKSSGQVICKGPAIGNFLFFSWLDWGSGFWVGRLEIWSVIFFTSYQEWLLSTWLN